MFFNLQCIWNAFYCTPFAKFLKEGFPCKQKGIFFRKSLLNDELMNTRKVWCLWNKIILVTISYWALLHVTNSLVLAKVHKLFCFSFVCMCLTPAGLEKLVRDPKMRYLCEYLPGGFNKNWSSQQVWIEWPTVSTRGAISTLSLEGGGCLGMCCPRKFWNFKALKCDFQHSGDYIEDKRKCFSFKKM